MLNDMFYDDDAIAAVFGLNVVSNELCYREEHDWSACRSPSRSKRRHARGIKTRVRVFHKPVAYLQGNTLHAHPAMVAQLKEEALARQSTKLPPATPVIDATPPPASLEDLLAPFSQEVKQKRQGEAQASVERRLCSTLFTTLSIRPLRGPGGIANIGMS